MGNETTFTKSLSSASSNNICTSQSGSAATPLVLNGAATDYLSTTTTAAVSGGGVILPLTSTSGLKPGQSVTDTTATALVAATKIVAVGASSVIIYPPVGGAGVGSGDTIVFPGVATIDTYNATTNSAPGRRVVIAYTGTDTSFNIVGTNATGNVITDVAVGAAGAAQSNLDFVTVTSITPVGGGLTSLTAGTNGVGSSPWWLTNWRIDPPLNVSVAVELVSGAVNFTAQYTYDDPNNPPNGTYPLAFNSSIIQGANTTIDGAYTTPIKASRILINSGTGVIRGRFLQAGVG